MSVSRQSFMFAVAIVLVAQAVPEGDQALAVGDFASAPWTIPTTGTVGFTWGTPLGGGNVHSGIDIWTGDGVSNSGAPGNPVYAAYKGRVVSVTDACGRPAGPATGNPNPASRVTIDHSEFGYRYWSFYGHMAKVSQGQRSCDGGDASFVRATPGQVVDATTQIGSQGDCCPNDNPERITHLHFQVNTAANPGQCGRGVSECLLDKADPTPLITGCTWDVATGCPIPKGTELAYNGATSSSGRSSTDQALASVGGKLAFTDQAGNLLRLDLATGVQQHIAGPPTLLAQEPIWSPDGSTLAFVGTEVSDRPGGGQALYVVSMPTGAPVSIVTGTAYIQNPAWFPDGQSLAYVESSGAGAGFRVHTVRVNGTENVSLPWPTDPDPVGDENFPAISPDGSKVAFAYRSCVGFNAATACHNGLATADPDGTSAFVVLESTERLSFGAPAWMPDGGIAYTRGAALHVLAPDGSQDTELLQEGTAVGPSIAVAPNGAIAVPFEEVAPSRLGPVPRHLILSGPDGSVLARLTSAQFDPLDKLQWIRQGAGLLCVSDGSLHLFLLDGSQLVGIPTAGRGFDWHP